MNKFLAGLFVPIIIAVAASYYNGEPQARPQLTPAQIERRAQAEAATFWRWQILWSGLTGAVLLAAVGGAYYVCVLPKIKRQHIHADPATGLWPIIREDRAPFWKRAVGIHDWIVEDPNLAMAPNRRVYANGSLHVEADTHGVPIDQQMLYAMQSWPVQRTVAQGANGARPNVAMMKAAAGVYDEQARRQRLLSDATERRMALADAPLMLDAKHTPVAYPDLSSALDAHRGPAILLGQSDGDLAVWQPSHDPHLGVWGKTQTGKTTRLGLTAAIGQLRRGWRLIIIDPEQEGDRPSGVWGTLSPWCEVVGPGAPGCSLWEQIMHRYEQRWRHINQNGGANYYHMPEGAKRLRPMAIHFDELARWRDKCRMLGGEWSKYVAQVDDCLAEIAQRGGKRGVHLTVYGQLPGELPPMLAANLTNLTFRQSDNQGNKVGFWHAHQLKDGQFAFDSRVYDSFVPLLEAPEILRTVGAPKPLLSVREGVRGERSSRVETHSPSDEHPKWDAWIEAYMQVHSELYQEPPQGIRALARAMSVEETGTEDNAGRYVGIASETCRRIRQRSTAQTALDQLKALGLNPNDIRLRGGDRLGVDPTHE